MRVSLVSEDGSYSCTAESGLEASKLLGLAMAAMNNCEPNSWGRIEEIVCDYIRNVCTMRQAQAMLEEEFFAESSE